MGGRPFRGHRAPAWCARPGACRGGAGGGAWRAAGGLGYGSCGAGRCSHWMPASVQRWSERCHGERPAAWLWSRGLSWLPAAWRGAGLAGADGLEARAARTTIPRLRRAKGPGAGFGVSGEDQDPSGSRVGEGTGWLSARHHWSARDWRAWPGQERGAPVRRELHPRSTRRRRRGRIGGCAVWLSGCAVWLSGCAVWLSSRRRLGCGQEPARWRGDAGPGTVVSGWLCTSRFKDRSRWRGIRFRLARTRNYQTWRHRPGGHEILRIIPAEQAGTLPLFLPRGVLMTISTRLVTFCIHKRPQSRHISGKRHSVPILTLSSSYGIARGLMLPIESERVQRAIF